MFFQSLTKFGEFLFVADSSGTSCLCASRFMVFFFFYFSLLDLKKKKFCTILCSSKNARKSVVNGNKITTFFSHFEI